MTNKPMLSVERELRTLAEKACGTAKDSPEYHRFLEAVNPTIVLDLTAESAAQHQGEPIYQVMYRGDGGGGWCDAEKDSYDMKVPHPKHWQTRIVYAEQPAPVAVVIPDKINPESLYPDQADCGWNDCIDEVRRLNGVKP